MGVEERVRKQTEQRKVGLGLAGVRDTWGKVFHAKPWEASGSGRAG